MKTRDYIAIQQFCEHYEVPVSFISSLHEFDLIEIVSYENIQYVKKNQIQTIEKIMRLHFDLDINMEGVDVIHNLLNQLESLQQQLNMLSNRLRFYEEK